jgi:hypothetical protein
VQLDNTRIVIRERDFLDILDLSLRVVRFYLFAWFTLSLFAALPFALLNAWLLSRSGPFHALTVGNATDSSEAALYVYRLVVLTVWEMPLVAAPLTRYLGHALFLDRPSTGRTARELRDSAPQLFLYQVLLRGVCILPAAIDWWGMFLILVWLLPFARSPYLNEIILLERNPLRANPGRITTARRSASLHAGSRSMLFSRLLASILFGAAMSCGIALCLWYIRGLLTRHWARTDVVYAIGVPTALWIAAAYFAVVRYLSYLDLRIRREGWEVELRVRAEADRLAGLEEGYRPQGLEA